MRVLFVTNDVDYFVQHRLSFARALQQDGFEIHLAAPDASGNPLNRHGITLHAMRLPRGIAGPWREMRAFLDLMRIIRATRPQAMHCIVLKAALVGGLAGRLSGVPALIMTLPGLGLLFVRNDLTTRIVRRLALIGMRLALGHHNARVIFENPDDRDAFVQYGAPRPGQATVIKGVGVDTTQFVVQPETTGAPIVLFASRMIWEKGVGDFVEAARICIDSGTKARFVLAGTTDPGNPGTVSEHQLRQWSKSGSVEWWGHCSDMPAVHAASHICCLPTFYGEGIPRVLIEAASAGRPLVATDWPGCREIVRHGENGVLVPPHEPQLLADALRTLIEQPELRKRMGERSREIALAEFDVNIVNRATLDLYAQVLRQPSDGAPRA